MGRTKIIEYCHKFATLHEARVRWAHSADENKLFAALDGGNALQPSSAASLLVRSSSVVEQTINGITVRMWDDPFEWTLPERLSSAAELIAYFEEVETARIRGFEFLTDDSDLVRSIPAPVKLLTLESLLTRTLDRSEKYLTRAAAALSQTNT